MPDETITIDAKDLYGDFCILEPFMGMKDGFEGYWQWPDNLGIGFYYLIKLRPGLMLTIQNLQSLKPLSIVVEQLSRFFSLSYIISGKMSVSGVFKKSRLNPENLMLNSGKSYLVYVPEYQGISNYPTSTSICTINVYMEEWLLQDILREEETGRCSLEVCTIIQEAGREKNLHKPLPIIPMVNMKLHEILSCLHLKRFKKLFLEGKTIELVAHSLSQLASDKTDYPGPVKHFPQTPVFVHEARDILLQNIQDPPSLLNLCRQVGVNKNKLNACFRQTYGTSVFDYLRIHRLEKSRELLASGKKRVSEVAFEVGYAQQSNFTREFKKYFGTNPQDHLC